MVHPTFYHTLHGQSSERQVDNVIESITLANRLFPCHLVSWVKLENEDTPIDVTTLTSCIKDYVFNVFVYQWINT